MFPEKHLKDLESSERKSKILGNALIALLFLTSLIFLGPIIHELGHLAILEFENCNYLFNIDLVFPNGINAEVSPLCVVRPAYLLLFYSVGYLATLSIGVTLNISGSILKQKYYSPHLIAIGTGMLLSVIFTIGVKGDIQNFLEIMNLDPIYGSLVALLIIAGVLTASIHGLENLLDQKGRNETLTSP